MSKTIDERVVEMRFDNKQFESNVATSMSTLDKLKQKLNLSGASKGLESISSAAKGVNLSGLGSAAETVGLKFNAMYSIADQALRNITTLAMNAGERLIKSLSIDQITAGWEKFGNKTTSVATLVAQGNDIDTVNKQLDKLNWFTDETSYNFTDMVANIAKFTAAGKGLDESVVAMEGIANWAALSGQNAMTASRAMYQISQAMGAGVMRLEDYKSIQNASMDTDEFRQKCLEAAVAMGTLQETSDGVYKSLVGGGDAFNKSQFTTQLTKGAWLTSDVMMKVFTDYSTAVDAIYKVTEDKGMLASEVIDQVHKKADQLKTDGMSDADAINAAIKELGYTAEDGSLLFDAFGLKAFEAAQKARTWGDAVDSVKDAVSTGWMNTFEIIFGNAEEATELFTDLANAMYDVFAGGAEARNEMLKGWKELGGRDDLIEGFWNVWEGFFGDGDKYLGILGSIKEAFREVFPPMTSERLASLTEGFKNLTAKLKPSEATLEKLKTIFKGVFSVLDIGITAIKAVAHGFGTLLSKFAGFSSGVLSGAVSLGDFLSNLRDGIKETNFFGNAVDSVVWFISKAIDKIKEFGLSLKNGFTTSDSGGIFGFFKGLWGIVTKVGSAVASAFGKIISTISDVLGKGDIFEVLNSGVLVGILLGVKKFTSGLNDALGNVGGFMENVKGILDDVRGCLQAYQEQLKAGALLKIAGAIAILAASLFLLSTIDPDSLGSAIASITILFTELVAAMTAMNEFGGSSKLLDTTAVKMIAMAASILILSAALKNLSGLSLEQMTIGLTAISAILWELVAVSVVMSKTGSKMIKGSIGLIALAAAIKILASACKDFGDMSLEQIGKGLASIGALLIELSVFEKIAGTAKHVVSTGASLILIAAAMKLLANAMKDFGNMDWTQIGKGLAGMGGALLELSLAMKLMPKGSMFRATGLLIAAASLKIVASALSDFGNMDWTQIGKGLTAMGGALAELAIGLNLMKGTLGGAAALLVASAALAIVVPVMSALGNMSWEQIAKGLITLAGAFAVIGVAGLLLKPLIIPILGLAGAFVLLGVGMVGIGAGLGIIAAGINALSIALSAGATSIVAALTVIVTGLLKLIPTIARVIGEGIVELAKVIGEHAPQLVESCLQLLTSVLQGLTEHAPQITDALFELLIGVINSLADHTPALIEALINLFSKIFSGFIDALKKIGVNSIRDSIDVALGLSALMIAMSAALKIAGSISIGSAIKGILALTAMAIPLLAFVGVLAVASGIDNATNNAKALAILAGACTIMLGVLTLIGFAWPAAAAGLIALTAMAIPMLAFVGVLALMNQVNNAMANATLLGLFMAIMTDVLTKIALVGPLALVGVTAMSALAVLMGAIGVLATGIGALMETFPSIQKFLDTGLPVLEKLAGSIGTMIGKFVTGITGELGDGLVKMGTDIAAFMAALSVASVNASMIKGESFDGVKELMNVMGDIALTTVGTSIGDIFTLGGTSMEKFQTDGVAFFNAMKAIGEASSDVNINAESMNSVISVAQSLADLQSSLDPIGGVISWFTGRDDLATFGVNAASFVQSLTIAFGLLEGKKFNTEGMNSIISAATSLSTLQSSLDPIGGVITWFTGRDDLGTFGANVASFIFSMKIAFSSLDGAKINTEAIDSIISAATSLSTLQSSLEPIGGVITWFTGRDDLGKFGANAASFISSMKLAFSSLDGVEFNTEAMESIISAATKLATLQSSLEPIGGVITWFTGRDDLGVFGLNLSSFIFSMKTAFGSLEGIEFNTEAMDSIISAATRLATLQSSLEPIGGVISWFAGRDDLATFGTSLASFISSMKTALTTLEGATLDEAALSSVISAATKLAEFQSSLEPMGGVVSWFAGRSDLGTFGTNLGLFADAMGKLKSGMGENGIGPEVITSITNSGNALIALQKALPEEHWFDGKMNLSDFSKRINDFADAMSTFGSKAAEIDSASVSTTINTAYRIKSLINSLKDIDTSGLATFTGVGTGGFGADGAAYKIAQAIAAFSKKVANIDTEAVSTSVWAAQRLKSLINSLSTLNTTGIENFKPVEIGKSIKSYADKVAGINVTTVTASITAANRLKTFISGLSGLDTSGISKFKVDSVGTAISNYSKSVGNFNAGAVNSSINSGNKIKTFISSLAGLDTGGVASFKKAINDLSTVNIGQLVKAFSGASSKLSNAGVEMINGLVKGMQSRSTAVTSAANKIAASAQKAVVSKASMFATAGGTLATRLANGFSNKKGSITSAISSCLSSATSSIRSYYWSFYDAGSYLVAGFASGISASTWMATARAVAMAQAAISAARSVLRINSPSKVFKAIGSGVPEGFALGIGMLGNEVRQSVNDMASTAITTTRHAMTNVLDALSMDMDTQPTIRPVVDLSDVQTGASAINGMLNGVQTLGVRSNLSAINSVMNAKLQNGTNDDIISAINKLGNGLESNRGDTYNFGDFTYGDDSGISDAVQTLVRAAKMGRRA